MKTIEEQVASARALLARREREFPGLVASGKLKAAVAEHEVECARGIVKTLETVALLREVSEDMVRLYRAVDEGLNAKAAGETEGEESNAETDQSHRVV